MSKRRILELRNGLGLSQESLGKKVGVTRQAIAQYEESERMPSLDIGLRMAVVLGVSPKYMMGESDDPNIDDRLPIDWVQTILKAMADGHAPEDVEKALHLLESAERTLGVADKRRTP